MTDVSQLKPQWFQILLAIADRDLHGLGIMKTVLEQTEGQMKLWPATLYGSLRDLEAVGWIRETDPEPRAPSEGGKRRFHSLTPLGDAALRSELERMRALLDVARSRDLIGEPEPAS